MGIQEAMSEALEMLNLIEVRGERSVAAMGRAMSLIKGAAAALEHAKEAQHDDHDQQG